MFPHVCDIKGRKGGTKGGRTWANWGSEQQGKLRYQIIDHTYLASRGLSCTPALNM